MHEVDVLFLIWSLSGLSDANTTVAAGVSVSFKGVFHGGLLTVCMQAQWSVLVAGI